MLHALMPADPRVRFPWLVTAICFFGLLFILNYPPSPFLVGLVRHYLPIHMMLEGAGMLVSFAVFLIGWATHRKVGNSTILLLSVTGFAVGWLDFGHTLAYTGMPDFVTPSGPNKAIYFWLASRFTDVLALLVIAIFYHSPLRFGSFGAWAMPVATLWTVGWFVAILFFADLLPPMFTPQEGLYPRKIVLEWIAIGLLSIAAVIFIWRARTQGGLILHYLAAACVISAMVGYFFTQYRLFDDLYNLSGHVYKTISFAFIYYAVFLECVSKPYEDMKRLAYEASEANESKVRFLANVSHEFRTPLGVISGFSDLLLEGDSVRGNQRQWVETISRNSRQLGMLIDDLLDLAKVETGKIPTHWTRFRPRDVADDVVAGLKLLAQRKGLRLTLDIDPAAPHTILSDALRFRQVLVNLVGNAIKFTDKGSVAVTLENYEHGDLRVAIRDTGIGIEPEHLDRLFRPFSQVEDAMNRRFGGTGLGLALSKRLAAVLGGDLWVEESVPGRGSLFLFTIRNQDASSLAVELAAEQKPAPSGVPLLEGKCILAAEDSMDNQELLSLYLRDTGARLEVVGNGIEAVKLVAVEKFDLILMDIQMPEMDGHEAVAKIRQGGWLGPIVALTAHAQVSERERALKNGFDDYLVKPFSKDNLWKTVRKHLGA